MKTEKHALEGKVLTNILIAEDRKAIKFETKDGERWRFWSKRVK